MYRKHGSSSFSYVMNFIFLAYFDTKKYVLKPKLTICRNSNFVLAHENMKKHPQKAKLARFAETVEDSHSLFNVSTKYLLQIFGHRDRTRQNSSSAIMTLKHGELTYSGSSALLPVQPAQPICLPDSPLIACHLAAIHANGVFKLGCCCSG